MSSLIVRATARVIVPLILALSAYLLLRGHDAPGGGFIAALVAGAAVVLRHLADGPEGLRRFPPVGFAGLLGTGLFLATGVGLAAITSGGEFLEGTIWKARLPFAGEIKLASSLLFDLGVYVVVVAVAVAIVGALGEKDG